jgi:hypothetical protein
MGLVPKRGCLLALAYYALPRLYEFGERRWNDTDREKSKYSEKNLPSATLFTTNPTWIDPGQNPGLRGERPATNDLSHVNYIYFEFSCNNILYMRFNFEIKTAYKNIWLFLITVSYNNSMYLFREYFSFNLIS